MPITVEMPQELEEQLREKAMAKGLTAEGYLLTLIEVIVQPVAPQKKPPTAYQRALERLRKKPLVSENQELKNPEEAVSEAVRQMRRNVLEYKEQAVEAVAKVNRLRAALDQQERFAADRELKAVCSLKQDEREQARRLFQEATVLRRNCEHIRRELATAAEIASEITRVFHWEEERVQARASKAQASAQQAFQTVTLTSEQIQKLIPRLQTEAAWNREFDTWVREQTELPSIPALETGSIFPSPDLKSFRRIAKRWARETKKKPDME